MPASLHAYAHLEDAWAGGVESWCRRSTDLALSAGTRSWLVCATRGQAEWVKSRLLRAHIPLLGQQFLQTSTLRRELCLQLGEPLPASEHETLTLVVRTLAFAAPNDRQCVAIGQHADEWLQALEELDAAGWLQQTSEFNRFVPKPLRLFVQKLRREAPEWLAGVDRRLRERAEKESTKSSKLRVAFLGWDASCFRRADLFAATASTALTTTCFVPLPRVADEEPQQQWQSWLARTLASEDDPCVPCLEPPHATLTSRLEGADLGGGPIEPPGLLVGKRWSDQIETIVTAVVGWLRDHRDRSTARIAIVLPTRNPTSVALGRRLSELGITHENSLGERPEPAWEARLLRSMLEYQSEGGSAADYMRLLSVRAEGVNDGWHAEAARCLPRAFDRLQSGLARHLVTEPPLVEVIAALGDWQTDAPVRERRLQWTTAIQALQLPSPSAAQMQLLLEPIWPSLEKFFSADRIIAGGHWLDFIGEALNSIPSARGGGGANARYARVVLTTLADAARQTWEAVILADANDEIWPFPVRQNPMLQDNIREALNARREAGQNILLTESDRAGMDEVHFLTLLENCSGPFWFAASGALADSPQRVAHPNEWALRCLIESTPNAMDAWSESIRRSAPPAENLVAAEKSHLVGVHTSRRDPRAPFDEYFLRFGPLSPRPRSLQSFAARTFEQLLREPAELAYRLVFDTSSQHDWESHFTRESRKIIGTIAHRWMRQLLSASGADEPRLNPSLLREALAHGITDQRQQAERDLSLRLLQAPRLSPSAWWKSVFAQAERVTRRWTGALLDSPLAAGDFQIVAERSFDASLLVGDAIPLSINGQMDLCLLHEGKAIVLDYKSSDKPAPIKPEKVGIDGEHIPLVVYLWLALANGNRQVSVGLVTAGGPVQDALITEADVNRFSHLAAQFGRQQQELLFGQFGPLTPGADGQYEALPIATVPISSAVLALKAEASGIGSILPVLEEGIDE